MAYQRLCIRCMYVYIYIHTYIHTCIYMSTYMHVYIQYIYIYCEPVIPDGYQLWRYGLLLPMFHDFNVSSKGVAAYGNVVTSEPAVRGLEPKVSALDWIDDRPLAGVQIWSLYIWVYRHCVSSSTHSHTYIYLHVYVYVHMNIHKHVCVCMYIYIYIYIYINI